MEKGDRVTDTSPSSPWDVEKADSDVAGGGLFVVKSAPEVSLRGETELTRQQPFRALGPSNYDDDADELRDPRQPIGASALKRLTTVELVKHMAQQYRPDFWENLPSMSKLFLLLSLLNVLLCLSIALLDVASNQQVCTCGYSHNIPLVIIDSCPPALRGVCRWEPQSLYLSIIACWVVAFYTCFAFVALLHEDAHALLASVLLLGIQACAIFYFTVAEWQELEPVFGTAAGVIGTITVALQLVLGLLALATHRQMGWRTYSRCAADVREKDAFKMRRLYLDIHKFTTALKMDLMVSLLLATVRVVVWLGLPVLSSSASALTTAGFIMWPTFGLLFNVVWASLCWVTVRHEKAALCKWITGLMPVSLIYFIAGFVAVILSFQEAARKLAYYGVSAEAQQKIIGEPLASLILLGVLTLLLLVIRVWTWFSMRLMMTRYAVSRSSTGLPDLTPLQAIRTLSVVGPHRDLERVHPNVLPLVRGAWIGKPSASNAKKKRFFQLSGDGTTLRWAWNKYILMLYVEEVAENEEECTLILVITAEPDLVLKFMDAQTYRTWRKGLQTLLALLLGPEGMEARPSGLGKLKEFFARGAATAGADAGRAESSSTAAEETPRSGQQDPSAPSSVLRQVLESQQQQQRPENTSARYYGSHLSAALGGIVTYSQRASLADPDGIRMKIAKDEAARRLQTDMSSGILLRRPLRAASAPSERLVAEVAEAERELQAEAQRGGGSEGRRESSETAPSLVPILEATWGTGSPSSSPAKLAQRASTLPSAQLLQAVFDSKEDIRREAAAAAAAANDGAVGAGGGGTFRRSTSAASDGAEGTTASTTAPSTRTSIGTGTRGILPRHIQDLQPGVPVAEQLGLSGRIDDVDFDELRLGKFLGAGAEGAVYAAWYNESPVAVKKTTNVHEVVMHVLAGSHDNIVSARAVALHEGELLIVMEYCPRGTLDTMVHHTMGGAKGKGGGPGWDPMKVVLPMVRSIARGILHLHRRSNPILHRDIKPGNIFVSHGLVMKIGDFGMSREVEANSSSGAGQETNRASMNRTFTSGVVGTSEYSAPELLGSTPEDKEVGGATMLKADVYSFGVTLWEILTRSRPFAGMAAFEIQMGWIMQPEEMRLPAVKVDPSLTGPARRVMEELSSLVEDCTAADPVKRPSAKEIVARIRKAGASDNNA